MAGLDTPRNRFDKPGRCRGLRYVCWFHCVRAVGYLRSFRCVCAFRCIRPYCQFCPVHGICSFYRDSALCGLGRLCQLSRAESFGTLIVDTALGFVVRFCPIC